MFQLHYKHPTTFTHIHIKAQGAQKYALLFNIWMGPVCILYATVHSRYNPCLNAKNCHTFLQIAKLFEMFKIQGHYFI